VPAPFSFHSPCFNVLRVASPLSQKKNDTDLACYNYDDQKPILIIFGKTIAESVSYQDVIYFFANVSAAQRTMHGACSTVQLLQCKISFLQQLLPRQPRDA